MEPTMRFGIIGDIHGDLQSYERLTQRARYSIQIGDLGLTKAALRVIDPTRHRFFGGNHDFYDEYYDLPHGLGEYGQRLLDDTPFYFIRGGYSIDRDYRIHHGLPWFKEEELSYEKMRACVHNYGYIKPDLVLSHSAPAELRQHFEGLPDLRNWGLPQNFTSNTQNLLQELFGVHRPRLWIFGHFHKPLDVTLWKTRFICIPPGEILDLDEVLSDQKQ